MNVDRRSRYSMNFSSVKELNINIDNYTLDIMCKFVISNNMCIRRGQLVNLRNLINILNRDNYKNDIEKLRRLEFITKGIEARLEYNLTDPYMILSHINGGIIGTTSVVDLDEFKGLNNAEISWLNNMVSETLKFSHVYSNADTIMDICSRIKSSDYGSKAAVIKEFEKAINNTQNDFRRAKNENQMDAIFSLRDGYFEDIMYDTYNTLNSPRRKLITGMQGMNELLGGGYENGRVYVYFGLPGEGKSSIILNIIYQIKKYNRDYRTKDPTKRPCVVLLTMENTVVESIDRLFGMATGRQHMTELTAENAILALKNEGELYLSDASPIDIIIKFKPSNSEDTSYLYTLTEDLEDQGLEVIAMFQDYIGRIRSTERLQDTRLEYGAVVDEFKTFAEIKDIPVITVAQLNRDASKHIDEGRNNSKADLVRLIGRSNISESMLILNNIDAGFLIAPETNQTGDRYLGIQRIKIRYDAGPTDVAYLPFLGNTLKLIEDFGGIANFKKTMMLENMNPCGVQSPYHINAIRDIGQTMKAPDSNDNIFSVKVNSSTNVTMDNLAGRTVIEPLVFFK